MTTPIKENHKRSNRLYNRTLFNFNNHINNFHYHNNNIHNNCYTIKMNILQLYRKYNREYMIMILCGAVVFLFADQNLMSPNLSLIAEQFHFNESERGL